MSEARENSKRLIEFKFEEKQTSTETMEVEVGVVTGIRTIVTIKYWGVNVTKGRIGNSSWLLDDRVLEMSFQAGCLDGLIQELTKIKETVDASIKHISDKG